MSVAISQGHSDSVTLLPSRFSGAPAPAFHEIDQPNATDRKAEADGRMRSHIKILKDAEDEGVALFGLFHRFDRESAGGDLGGSVVFRVPVDAAV